MSAVPARVAWAVELIDPGPADRVLEVGCGPGAAAALIGARLTTGRLLAVDRSAVAVRRTADRVASARLTDARAASVGVDSARATGARVAGTSVAGTLPGGTSAGGARVAGTPVAGTSVAGGMGVTSARLSGPSIAPASMAPASVARAPVEVRQASLGDLDFDGEFDVAFTLNVNVFWTRPDGPELGVLARALRPGGRVLILYGANGPTGADRVTAPIAAAMTALGLTGVRVVTGEHGIGVVGHRPG